MYATIRRYDRATSPVDDAIPDGRRLAVAISRLPGFVAYALLDAGDGALVAVNLFDHPSGVAGEARLVGQWASGQDGPLARPSEAISGEVIVQKGI